LKAFARVDRESPIRDQRYDVLEHCEFPTRAQIAECARLGIAPTTSTNFCGARVKRSIASGLGAAAATARSRCRDWLDGGVPIAQSTDWGPARGPVHGMAVASHRRSGLTGDVIAPAQRITREEAIRCFTWNGAWALKMEHELGSIEPGKRADLIVLDGDLMGCPEDDIRNLRVDLTLLDGRPVHGTCDHPGDGRH